jgi:NhaP-type Na+/H+ or K+/H+ antiporter
VDLEIFAYLAFGLLILTVAWLPLFTRNIPLSLPSLAVAAGLAFGWWTDWPPLVPGEDRAGEIFINLVLIIAVMGAGLKIDRRFHWSAWASAWRLLIGVMLLTILGLTACGVAILGVPLGEAILLAAILAPTDPVLAGSVEAGPPGVGEEGEVRFALTAEAGANDGLAFPFVLLGIALMSSGEPTAAGIGRWMVVDLIWSVGAAVAIGIVLGWVLIRINQLLPERYRLSRSGSGVVSIGITCLTFAVAELAHAYGLIAVFAAAVTIRNTASEVEYTRHIHDSAEEIERVAMMVFLVFFGIAIAGGLLSVLRPVDAAYTFLVLFLVRPLASAVSFVGSPHPWPVRLASGFLGVRGIASLYYITYVTNHTKLTDEPHMRALVAVCVLVSIFVFGVAAEPMMRYLDKVRAPPKE